jgi:hypothetical protein
MGHSLGGAVQADVETIVEWQISRSVLDATEKDDETSVECCLK